MSAARWMLAAEEAQRRRSESSAMTNDAVSLVRNSRHLSLRMPFTSPLSQDRLHVEGALATDRNGPQRSTIFVNVPSNACAPFKWHLERFSTLSASVQKMQVPAHQCRFQNAAW